MIKKEIKTPLINTWEQIEMLRAQYEEPLNHPKLEKVKEYYNKMDSFERDILVLYAEYDSYRKVAEETYCSYGTVKLILTIIKQDIESLINS